MSSIKKIVEPDQPLDDNANYGSRTASGNARLFNCKQCNRAFTREEHLTRHTLSTHNKLKPFVCGLCHRPFSRRDLLLRHAKNLHQGSERAVSRIRKSYKRGSRDDSRDGDDENEGDVDDDHHHHHHQQQQPQPQSQHPQHPQHPQLQPQPQLHHQPAHSHIRHDHNHKIQLQHPLSDPSQQPPHLHHLHSQAPPLSNAELPSHLTQIPQSQSSQTEQINDIRLSENSLLNQGYDTPEKKRLKMSVNMLVS